MSFQIITNFFNPEPCSRVVEGGLMDELIEDEELGGLDLDSDQALVEDLFADEWL